MTGPEFLLLGICLFLVVILLRRGGSSKSVAWSERRVDSDESTVRYRNSDGQVQCEHDSCNGCIQLRAAQLQREGFVVVEVEIGRRNSGSL